ncbi:MAG: peptide ABC transporter substrate-binding protein [Dehalococcoidales bacterium]|nr:peptide ABC transporter substrate-binding protein [Dehalococcoidales bacterium]
MIKKVLTIFFSLVVVASLVILPSCSSEPSAPQILTANLAGEPAQIDPNRASWSTERTVIMQVFEGLLGFNQDLSLKAIGATEIPTVENGGISADGKTYTFTLNQDVTWSDGEKVTAGDYEYSIKRLFDPINAAEYASFYFDIIGSDAYYTSADQDAAAQAALKDAVGVTALDEYTLEIKLNDPRPTFLQLMALWPVYPVREDIITQYGDQWTSPATYIGNGPFLMTEWVHSDHITLVRNEDYWGEKAKLDTVVLKMITDVNAEFAAYQNNELDISQVPAGTEKTVMADATLSPQILRYAELVTFGFQFNLAVAPFDNKYLRKAINAAIDRDSFINNVRGGVGKAAYSWIPPGMPGYDETLGADYHFDVAQAQAFLTQAGYTNGSEVPELRLQYADTGTNPTIAQFIQNQLKVNLNIDVSLEPMERAAFSQMVNAEQHTWAWFGWGADYPDPDNWLPELFGTDAGNNHTNYSSAAFDALAAQAKKELNNTLRLQMWADAQAMVVDDAPVLFMQYRERFRLVNPKVKGLLYTGMDGDVPGDMFFANVWIEA